MGPGDRVLGPDERAIVIQAVANCVESAYVFPQVAGMIADAVRKRLQDGAYDAVTAASALRDILIADMHAVHPDPHLAIFYSPTPLPAPGAQPAADAVLQMRRDFAVLFNCGVHRVERLAGNIGFIDLRFFEEPAFAGEVIAAAMWLVTQTAALIIDLRRCPGGHPGTVSLLCSYFFDATPVHLNSLYWRPLDATEEFWTQPEVAGPRYLGKPLYLLTSSETFSAAEECAYNLQTRQRATIVGERTRGGAHVVQEFPIGEHFVVAVPVGRAINPVTGTNWDGVGVLPEREVPAANALRTAHRMALNASLSLLGALSSRAGHELQQEVQATLADLEGAGTPG